MTMVLRNTVIAVVVLPDGILVFTFAVGISVPLCVSRFLTIHLMVNLFIGIVLTEGCVVVAVLVFIRVVAFFVIVKFLLPIAASVALSVAVIIVVVHVGIHLSKGSNWLLLSFSKTNYFSPLSTFVDENTRRKFEITGEKVSTPKPCKRLPGYKVRGGAI